MPRVVPRLAAVAVAVVGVGFLITAAVVADQASGDRLVAAGVHPAAGPVTVTAPGLLDLVRGGVRISAETPDPDGVVFIGVGRSGDVEAYLGDVARAELTGLDPDRALTRRVAGIERSVPDPASADIWALSVQDKGTAELDWPQQPGRWVAVIASDGAGGAPERISLTWSRTQTPAMVPVLVAIGALLLVAGVAAFAALTLRRPERLGSRAGPQPRSGARGRRRGGAPNHPGTDPASWVNGDDTSRASAATPAAEGAAPGEPLDLFAPRTSAPTTADTGVIDRRQATPGLAADRPTTQLRRVRMDRPRRGDGNGDGERGPR